MADPARDLVFFVDVDNTLLDNDAVVASLHAALEQEFGAPAAARYWVHYERRRSELGYADYLGALQDLRADVADRDAARLLQLPDFLLDHPFAERLYPGALDALRTLGRSGTTIILSDGDVVLQPRKIRRAGLWDAVEGRVVVCVHKERVLDEVRRRFPARHHVMVDDKPRILGAVKAAWGTQSTTVFPRQGRYAHDAAELARYPRPDVIFEHIGEIAGADPAAWPSCAAGAASTGERDERQHSEAS